MAQAGDIVAVGVSLHVATPSSENHNNPKGASTLEFCAPSNTPRLRESHCQNSAPSVPLSPDPKLGEAKKLLFEFLTVYFGAGEVFGVQAGFGPWKDTYLVRGPYGSTLCIETDIMTRKTREEILEIVGQKLAEKRRLFEKPSSTNFSEGTGTAIDLGKR
jgi:hypothetical protein